MKKYLLAFLLLSFHAHAQQPVDPPKPMNKQEAQKHCEAIVEQEEERRLYKEQLDKCVKDMMQR